MSYPVPQSTDHDDGNDAAEFIAAVTEGMAAADAGRVVPYEAVRQWLLSWGTDHELPPPKCG